jgi:hypothetical protein
MQYAIFFAVWLLSSLILGAVHGPAMGTFLGLAIATGYVLALRASAAVYGGARVCSANVRTLMIRRRHRRDDASTAF